MRICFIGPLNSIHLQRWVTHFSKQGHEVHVVTLKSTYTADFSERNMKVHIIEPKYPAFSKILPQKSRWALKGQISKFVSDISPDIVHGHRAAYFGYYTAKCGNYPKMLSVWGEYDFNFEKSDMVSNHIMKKAVKNVDMIHSDADVTTETLVRFGVPRSKIHTIPIGVDMDKFNINAEPIRERKKTLVIISNRGFYPVYNIKLLINAIPEVMAKYPESEFLIAGSGTDESELKALTKENKVDGHVRFLGEVPYTEMPRWYRASDIYVSTSLTDGTHLSLLEAMACGLFPVVTDIPANRSWIKHSVNGMLSPVDKPGLLAQNIISSIGNKPLRDEAIKANLKMVGEKCRWDITAAKMDKCYEELSKIRGVR